MYDNFEDLPEYMCDSVIKLHYYKNAITCKVATLRFAREFGQWQRSNNLANGQIIVEAEIDNMEYIYCDVKNFYSNKEGRQTGWAETGERPVYLSSHSPIKFSTICAVSKKRV